jgi:hypothetical protein
MVKDEVSAVNRSITPGVAGMYELESPLEKTRLSRDGRDRSRR